MSRTRRAPTLSSDSSRPSAGRAGPQPAALTAVTELIQVAAALIAELNALEREVAAHPLAPTLLAINKLQAVVGEIEVADVLTHRIAKDLHRHVKLPGVRCSLDDERLSEREREVLGMLAGGSTVSEIATRLAINVKTVSTYRLRALRKLELGTTAQLVRYGITHHLDS